MRKYIIGLLVLFAIGYSGTISGQDAKIIDLGIFKRPEDPRILDVKIRPDQDVNNGSYSAGIFTVRLPSQDGTNLTVVPGSSPYGYAFAGPVGTADGFDYYRFQFSGSVYFVNWERNVEYPILTLKVEDGLLRNPRIELVTDNEWTRQHNGDYYQELLGQELERNFYFLPLDVKGFIANPSADQSVELSWVLENENMLANSEVEYSVDGQDFTLIGEVVASRETSTFEEAYAHVHDEPGEVNYYRVRLTDINGAVTYTPTRVVYFDGTDTNFAVFPNPTSGRLTLASNNLNKYPDGVDYQVVDNSGKVLWTDRVAADNLEVNLAQLPGGVYFVKVVSSDKQLDEFKVILIKD